MRKLLIGIIILFLLVPSAVSVSINKTSQSKNGKTLYVGGNDSFILLNSTYDGGSYKGVWGDGTYIFVACNPDGIRAYSFDGNNLTLEGHRDDGGLYSDVWSDGIYIYVACYLEGIRAYSFDGNNFTLKDTRKDNVGEHDRYFRIWGDGSYIYVVCLAGGLRAYSFDGNTLTMEAHRYDGGSYQGIRGDGNYVYAGCKSSGIRAYSFNGYNFTLLDTYLGGSDYEAYYEIWCQNNYIFSSVWSEGIKTFSFDGNKFSYLSGHYYGGCYMGCWGDGSYVFTTSKYEGLMAYSFDGHNLLLEGIRDDGGWYFSLWGDGTYIYAVCLDDGLRVYRFIDDNEVLYVGGSGPGNYTKIQDAIDNASDGDTVFVFNDSSPYYEHVRISEKSIKLIGENKNTTVIDANYTDYPIIMLSSNDVVISGFTLINPKEPPHNNWESVLIKIINCRNTTIENNIVIQYYIEIGGCNAGIYLLNSCNNIIRNNIIYNTKKSLRSRGIMLDGGANLNNLSNNEIYNFNSGICLYSNDNTIYENYIYHNIWGIDNSGKGTKIINNIITANTGNGIDLDGGNNFVSGNIITNNGNGEEFDNGLMVDGQGNYIFNNQISFNNPTGIELFVYSAKNQIIHNNITNNLQIGIYGDFTKKNSVLYNNFIDNGDYNACFEQMIGNCFSVKWNKNYWNDKSGKSYHRIPGRVYFIFAFGVKWFNFDWNPASEPYDIPGSSNFVGCGIK